MGVDKYRNILSGGVIERNNGANRIVGFMDFGEEVKSRDVRIRDMEEEDVLGEKNLKGPIF